MQTKLSRHERSRRLQTFYVTITAGIVSAAVVAGIIYFCYRATHLRM